jgi:hypothetical protein
VAIRLQSFGRQNIRSIAGPGTLQSPKLLFAQQDSLKIKLLQTEEPESQHSRQWKHVYVSRT